MSIDWLFELERSLENGKEVLACPNMGKNQWVIGKPLADLKKLAKKVADHKKMPVTVVRLVSVHDAVAGDQYLAPTKIEEPGNRGEPSIQWSTFDTREASEMMRDVRHGPSPFFGMQILETINPDSPA